MLLLFLGSCAAAFLFYYLIIKPYDYWKDRGVKQGKPLWLLGDNWKTILAKQSVSDLVQVVYNQCSGVRYSGIYQFRQPILVVKDPDLIKQIAVKNFEHFTDHNPFIPEDADPLWGKNLFFLTGQKWRDMRGILSPSFTSSKMRSMFKLISECADNFVHHFTNKNECAITIEFKDTFTRFTNDVIASTAFGLQVDSLNEPNNQFYLMVKETTDFSSVKKHLIFFINFLFPKLSKFLKLPLLSAAASQFFRDVVSDTIKMRQEKGIVRPDMINLLLEAGKGVQKQEDDNVIDTGFSVAKESDLEKPTKQPKEVTDLDITAQAMIFFFAGFDTVSGLMSFLSYELAINKDIQDKLRQEIKYTLQKCQGKLTYEDLLNMRYMDMVVSEALRKWPVFVAVDRVCTRDYTIEPVTADEKPLHLKKGSVVWLPIYGMHHDPEYFPDPERFDPERFSDENKGNIKPYTYFPFGLGPRNCIGSRFALLETKTVMFHILNHFELVPVEKSQIPVKLSKKQINLSAQDGFWFGLKRIQV